MSNINKKDDVVNIIISKVDEYNEEQLELYHKHRLDKRRKHVMLDEYVILTKKLSPRKRGYVFTINEEAQFNLNKKKTIELLNEKIKNI
jgi:hypothetical protein